MTRRAKKIRMSDRNDPIARVPSDYPLQVGVHYLGHEPSDGRRMITAIEGDTVSYAVMPSLRFKGTATVQEFTDWAAEVYLGSGYSLPKPDGMP